MNEEFNVVIAEDEKRICSLIKALIDWDGLHLRLVGEAHDGVQALTLLQQEKVDILITDIRMPGVNGLDLTKWVNDHCNQCSVIIISGYKQFDYAYDALRMDVVDFLLKPIRVYLKTPNAPGQRAFLRCAASFFLEIRQYSCEKMSCATQKSLAAGHIMSFQIHPKKTEINNAISKIVQKRSVSSPNTSTIQLEVQQFRTSLRRQCIHSFLYNSSLRDVPLETFNKTTGMEFQNGDFVAIILQLYEPNSSLDGHFSRYSTSAVQSQPAFPVGIGDKLRDLLVAGLISKVIDIEAEFIDDTLYCIVNLDPNSRESFIRSLKRIKDILKEHIDVFRYRFLLTVSNFHSNYTAFPTAFQEARMLIPCKCALSGEGPFLWNDFPLPPLTLPKLSLKSECRRAAETRETKQIFYVIHDLIETHSTLFLTDPRLINSFLRQLFDAIWVIASNHTWLTPDALLIMQKYLVSCSSSLHDLEKNCCQLIDSILVRLQKEVDSTNSMPVRTVKQLISKNFANTISLDDLAKEVNLSPPYLSELFKNETGETISNYIQRTRIEMAQHLLLTTMMNVTEVADAVGYADAKYFSRVFRKHLGIRPSDFRYLNKWG